YMILLNKYTNQKDIVVGTPVLGRLNPIYYNTVGMFVNTLAIKSSVKEEMTISNYLIELKNDIQEALANQDYQFDELVQKLHIKRGLNRNPLFDTMFIWQNDGFGEININDLEIQSYQIDHKTAKFDLKLEGIKEKDEIVLYLEYSVDLFKKSTAEGITKHYSNILEQIAFNSDRKISDIQLISDAQKGRTVQDFNEIL
ncbi:condensation domain-containing protein, partial [Abyssisolibacter fermentans]|uniref:condensation domain-containing protein n=1 Tax=Abyssisolibacter fermentans TaxID=1766203 RepID=UPI0012E33CDD